MESHLESGCAWVPAPGGVDRNGPQGRGSVGVLAAADPSLDDPEIRHDLATLAEAGQAARRGRHAAARHHNAAWPVHPPAPPPADKLHRDPRTKPPPTSSNNLAGAYRLAGRLTEAIPLYERTLTDRERLLGPDHPDTLTSQDGLAGAYQAAGRLTEAIPLYERTLTDRERLLGPDHPDTRATQNNLANARRPSEA